MSAIKCIDCDNGKVYDDGYFPDVLCEDTKEVMAYDDTCDNAVNEEDEG